MQRREGRRTHNARRRAAWDASGKERLPRRAGGGSIARRGRGRITTEKKDGNNEEAAEKSKGQSSKARAGRRGEAGGRGRNMIEAKQHTTGA